MQQNKMFEALLRMLRERQCLRAELQLQGLLYLFSRRSRSTLPGLGVPIDGGIALAPLREVLPEPGVVQFLA